MVTLYFAQGACPLATQTVLRHIGQPVDLIDVRQVQDFKAINPVGTVPVLVDGETTLTEGAAILLHLLDRHDNTLLPTSGPERSRAIEALMLANATLHPAYGRLFFAAQHISDAQARAAFMQAAADAINALWQVVDERIGAGDYVANNQLSPADILLTVYASWSQAFPVSITLGANVERMIARVEALPAYQQSLAAEAEASAVAA